MSTCASNAVLLTRNFKSQGFLLGQNKFANVSSLLGLNNRDGLLYLIGPPRLSPQQKRYEYLFFQILVLLPSYGTLSKVCSLSTHVCPFYEENLVLAFSSCLSFIKNIPIQSDFIYAIVCIYWSKKHPHAFSGLLAK